MSGTHTCGDRFALILGPQPPRAWLKSIAYDGGQLGLALGIGREPRQHGRGEGTQPRVVVPEREFVQAQAQLEPEAAYLRSRASASSLP